MVKFVTPKSQSQEKNNCLWKYLSRAYNRMNNPSKRKHPSPEHRHFHFIGQEKAFENYTLQFIKINLLLSTKINQFNQVATKLVKKVWFNHRFGKEIE